MPEVGTVWIHRKGGLYRIVGSCRIESSNAEAVLYEGMDGTIWARPVSQWHDRFTQVLPDPTP